MSNSKVNFSLPQGVSLNQDILDTSNSSDTSKDQILNPSVVVYGWIPTMGDGNTLSSGAVFGSNNVINPINTAASRYYQKQRAANSSLAAYSAGDIAKGIVALDSLYGLLDENKADIVALTDTRDDSMAFRGVLRKVLWRNPDVARANLSNIIMRHNAMCESLKALPFIPGIPFLKDHLDWSSKVYKDDNLKKSGIFLFRRSGFYYWEVNANDPEPGFLMLRDGDLTTYSYTKIDRPLYAEERMDIIEYLITQYTLDDDILNISSEIYKAYGYNPDSYTVPKLPADTSNLKLDLTYDLDVIDSLKNADFNYLTTSPRTGATSSIYGIGEDTNGNLKYAVGNANNLTNVFPVDAIAVDGNDPTKFTAIETGTTRVLYSYYDDPTEESVKILTRYTHVYRRIPSSASTRVYGLKTEFLTSMKIGYYDPTAANNINDITLDRFILNVAAVNQILIMALLQPLIACPTVHLIGLASSQYNGTRYSLRKDIDNLGFEDVSWLLQCANMEVIDKFTSDVIKGSEKIK